MRRLQFGITCDPSKEFIAQKHLPTAVEIEIFAKLSEIVNHGSWSHFQFTSSESYRTILRPQTEIHFRCSVNNGRNNNHNVYFDIAGNTPIWYQIKIRDFLGRYDKKGLINYAAHEKDPCFPALEQAFKTLTRRKENGGLLSSSSFLDLDSFDVLLQKKSLERT